VATGGRVELGLGWGSMPDELRRFGFGVESGPVRAARMAETLDILELMFSGEPFSYDGSYYTLPDAVGRPRPVNGRIPIQIGGLGPKLTLPLVARYADWRNCPSNGLERLPALQPLIGRARIALQVVVGLAGSSSGREQVAAEAEQRFAATWGSGVIGTPDEVARHLAHFVELGVGQLIIQFSDYGRAETIELFAREVIPAVHALRAPLRSTAVTP
jgi:alkanesulfonate monooxygenase SsuD/methylene tetrahydromethanopterin reductase-like flavin-dependent oxidoreductase (luciferase family)